MFSRRSVFTLGFSALATLTAGHAVSQTNPLVISYPQSNILPNGIVGSNYGMNLSTSGGGTRPVTWSIISGKLPSGLKIIKNWSNSSSSIYGVPTRQETVQFTVEAQDKSENKANRAFTLTIN